jgi:hypothetical protein
MTIRRVHSTPLTVASAAAALALCSPFGASTAAASVFPAQAFTEYAVWNHMTSYFDENATAPGEISVSDSDTHVVTHSYFDNGAQTTTTSVSVGFSARAHTVGGGRPTASANVSVIGGGSGSGVSLPIAQTAGGHALAVATIEYFVRFRADGALGALIGGGGTVDMPVHIAMSGGASASYSANAPIIGTGGYARASGSLTLSSDTPFDITYANSSGSATYTGLIAQTYSVAAEDAYLPGSGNPKDGSLSPKITAYVPVRPGGTFDMNVRLRAGAEGQAFGGAYGGGRSEGSTATAAAYIDPVFMVDPGWAYADLVSIDYSPAVTQGVWPAAVPLPAAAPLLLIGLAALRVIRGLHKI